MYFYYTHNVYVCVCFPHRAHHSLLVSRPLNVQGTGTAAVLLSLHNKPSFSAWKTDTGKQVAMGKVMIFLKCVLFFLVTGFVLTCGKAILRSADSWVFFSTLSSRGRTTSWVSMPDRITNVLTPSSSSSSSCHIHFTFQMS